VRLFKALRTSGVSLSVQGLLMVLIFPAMNHIDYYNRKGFYSMIVQALVDHNCMFRNICVGWPGSVHDARVFSNSLRTGIS